MGGSLGSARNIPEAVCETTASTPSIAQTISNGCWTVSSKENEFILHGIDYLPEFEKRRERRRRKLAIPRFLRIDTSLWTTSYLRFLGRMGRSSPGPEETEHQDTTETVTSSLVTTPVASLPFADGSEITELVETPAGQMTMLSDEWISYASYPFENIVMSGGGSKGYAYIGALKALEDCGVLKSVKKIAGSSAGAICAGLLAVGCTPQDIADVFRCNIKWLFHDQPCECCCCLPRLCNKYGVHPARRFYRIYGDHIARKVGNPDITFKQVLDTCGRELCIVVTNLSRMCSEYCCPSRTPDLPIRDAVRMSMSFPLVFRAVRRNISGRDCLYADGGILDQYPISVFDEVESELNHNTQRPASPTESALDLINDRTLGLYLVSEKAMDYKIWQTLFGKEIPYKPTYLPNTKLARARLKRELSNRKRLDKEFSKKEYMEELKANDAVSLFDHYQVMQKSHVDINNFGEYFMTAIETLLVSQRKMHVKERDVARTIAINCGYIGTSDYVIEPGDREFMIRQGYECTRRWLMDFVSHRPVGLSSSRHSSIHKLLSSFENEVMETVPNSPSGVSLASNQYRNDTKLATTCNANGTPPSNCTVEVLTNLLQSADGSVTLEENTNLSRKPVISKLSLNEDEVNCHAVEDVPKENCAVDSTNEEMVTLLESNSVEDRHPSPKRPFTLHCGDNIENRQLLSRSVIDSRV